MKSNMKVHKALKQTGFSLIEIMIGLVIGLLATLVIVNVFSVFERQKSVTTGSSDAQTNGAIALYNVQRDVQQAGYGLPVYSTEFSPYNCAINTAIDHDNDPGTAGIGLSPILITDGNGADGSDTISVRNGNSMKGGIANFMIAGTASNIAQVDTNIGCDFGDIALILVNPGAGALVCSMTRVAPSPGGLTAAGVTPVRIAFNDTTNVAANNAFACLGTWSETSYTVAANQLTRSVAVATAVPSAATVAVPIVPDIVNIQAQYGISATVGSNQVTQWVNATGAFANTATTPSVANRNLIKAVRIAVVARSGLLEPNNVTTVCSGTNVANPTGLCSWDGAAAGSQAPAINLTDANWQRYRYRVYESITPVRNIIWSREAL